MAEIIRVSTDQMRNTVRRFESAQATLGDAYRRMDQAIANLGCGWKGEAFAAMRAKWSLIYSNICRSNEKMQDAIDELNASADLFDENEMKQLQKFESLDVGDSPFNC